MRRKVKKLAWLQHQFPEWCIYTNYKDDYKCIHARKGSIIFSEKTADKLAQSISERIK